MTTNLEALVDMDRYPITHLQSRAATVLLDECRSQIAGRGACLLDGFIRAEALTCMLRETESLIALAHHYQSETTTAYQETVPLEERSDHPRKFPRTSSNHVLAYDLIPPTAAVRRVYESDAFLNFVAAVLEEERLYRYADPLGALNIAVSMNGDHNGWHFDQCDFVTSILLREAQHGGQFEYVANIRSQNDENYPSVKRVLEGDRQAVTVLPLQAGSLSIFKGRHSIHRVTKIGSSEPRLIALLGYDTQPDVQMTKSASLRRFGRVS